MKNTSNPKRFRVERDLEAIFLGVCKGMIIIVLLGAVAYAAFI